MSNDLNSFLFSTAEMTRVFSAEAQLRAMMRFERALTGALEAHGLAEAGSGAALDSVLEAGFVDVERLKQEAREDGNVAIPFVRQLTSAVKERDERAARAIHLGATSQDVLDTALALQIREGVKLLESAIAKLDAELVKQVRAHRETLMTGRTWLQAGPPTTLGLKLAGTLSALRRHRERIEAAASRAAVLQFGGAVGTLAALGGAGERVSAELARSLELREAELPWHTQRDGFVEMVEALTNLTGSLAKFAGDIALLMQPEIGEAAEGSSEGRGGSSTMPQKHNPVSCAAVIAAHRRMPGLVATMLHAMPQEHERGLGLWQAEWETVPEAFRLTAAALEYAIEIAAGLVVDEERMRANFDALLGIPMAEAVSAALAPKIGRSAAHQILREASKRAKQEGRHLADVLKGMPEVNTELRAEEIDGLMDPRAYLGSAQRFITRVLGEPNARR
jgi:3-carboxy-cis,cis-muconate cycloisomerase